MDGDGSLSLSTKDKAEAADSIKKKGEKRTHKHTDGHTRANRHVQNCRNITAV